MSSFEVRVDVKTTNPTNGSVGNSRLAGILKAKRRREVRAITSNTLFFGRWSASPPSATLPRVVAKLLPAAVTLTRIAPSNGLDPHDGLRTALKGCVDGVADWLGLSSDRDPRVEWRYDQRRGRSGEYAVLIRVEPKKA